MSERNDTYKPLYHRAHGYLFLVTLLLIVAAFFRLWMLGTAPPGLSEEEFTNIELAMQMRQGNMSVIYDEVQPAREGLYYIYLTLITLVTGKGLILWRLPSVWLSMLGLAALVSLARRLFGMRVALMALGLVAVNFWAIWMGRAVLHVTLVPPVTCLIAYFFVRAFQSEELDIASIWFTLGGLALGFAQYTHVTAWTMILLLLVFVLYRRLVDRRMVRHYRGNVVYALILAAILYLPLLFYLIKHPGVREPFPLAEQPRLLLEIPGRLLASITALGLHGDRLPEHNLPGWAVMNPVLASLALVGFGVAAARWKRSGYGFLLIWLLIGFLPAAFLPRKPDFEFMAVILPVIFIFPAVGIQALYQAARSRLQNVSRRATGMVLSGLVGGLILVSGVFTYRDYFISWPAHPAVRQAYQANLGTLAHYLDTTPDLPPVSICSIPPEQTKHTIALSGAERLSYLLHRHNLPLRYFDCRHSLVIADAGNAQLIAFLDGHYYDHLPGPLLRWMRYAEDAGIPGIAPDVVMRLEVDKELADQLGTFLTDAPTAWPPETGLVQLADLPVLFEENVAFLGYSIRDDRLKPADWVELTTYWRVDGSVSGDITLFAHLLGNPVVVIAQTDSLGVQTATLYPRDIFIQYSLIQTPGNMAKGLYPISVGLYYEASQQRVIAYTDQIRADRLFLQRIEIEP